MPRSATMPLLMLAVLVALVLSACGDDAGERPVKPPTGATEGSAPAPGADFAHVHGLGINPRNGLTGKLMVSRDTGRSWTERQPPAGMFDLAVAPADDKRIVIATEDGLFSSADAGKGWRPLDSRRAGLLTWTPKRLYLVAGDGQVSASTDEGGSWRDRGSIGGQPAAFESAGEDLYAAQADGTVVRSVDAGATWTVRARP